MIGAARLGVAAALLATVVAAQPPVDVGPAAARWSRILYLHGGPPHDGDLLDRVRDLGFTAVGGDAALDPALPARHGLRFYVDQAVGKGVLEVREPVWRAVRDRYRASRDPDDLVRSRCLSHDETLRELETALRDRLNAAGPHAPLALSLADEASVTRHANPLDLCFAAPSLARFREFLAGRYADVAALNVAWGTEFGAMDRVVPLTADQIRRRERVGQRLPTNLAPWAEHREFMDGELARVTARLVEVAGRVRPGLRVGLTGMQPPSAYGGHDYAKLVPSLTFVEAYDIGGARDLAACLLRPDAMQVVTVFPPRDGEPARLPEAVCHDALAHGFGGVIAWSAGEVFGASAPTAYGELLGRVWRDLERPARSFAGARLRRAPIWIVDSQASVRAHWMLDSAADGETWIERLSSYEAEHSTSLAARHSWLRLFEDLGLQARLVPAATLAGELRRGAPRLLVLPVTVALSDASAAAITGFVRDGGIAVADHGLGFYDERLRSRGRGALDELFGVRRPPLRGEDLRVRGGRGAMRLASGVAVAESGLSGPIAQAVGEGVAIHLENRPGRGRTFYLNLAVCEYASWRLVADQVAAARDVRARLRGILQEAGVRPWVELHAVGLPTCLEQLHLRTVDGRRLLGVRVNALENPALLAQLAERGPRPVEIGFATPVELTDLATGREYPAGRRFSLTLDPFRALFLEVRAAR